MFREKYIGQLAFAGVLAKKGVGQMLARLSELVPGLRVTSASGEEVSFIYSHENQIYFVTIKPNFLTAMEIHVRGGNAEFHDQLRQILYRTMLRPVLLDDHIPHGRPHLTVVK